MNKTFISFGGILLIGLVALSYIVHPFIMFFIFGSIEYVVTYISTKNDFKEAINLKDDNGDLILKDPDSFLAKYSFIFAMFKTIMWITAYSIAYLSI